MNCRYCQTWNAEEEHRCARCGRRLKLPSAVVQTYPVSRSAQALALAEHPSVIVEEDAASLAPRIPIPQSLRFVEPAPCNIIPFESIAAHRTHPVPDAGARTSVTTAAPPAIPQPPTLPRPQLRRRPSAPQADERQVGLDFLVPPPQSPRTLKTQVEAVIYCDAAVAKPKHRAIAAAIDGGMIFIGFGLFLFAFHCMGGVFRLNRQNIPFFIGVFGTLAMFYGLLWIWSGRETAGMRWTGLCLINFDGLPAGRRDRILRTLAGCLSFCAGGIGLLWSLVDEEKLAWHDHMSKTFPTCQETNASPFRRR